MKKIAALLLTFSMTCNAFTTPLALERSEKMLWYRCIYLNGCVYRLNDLREVCDAHGWDEHSSLEIEEIIESMKHNLGFPKTSKTLRSYKNTHSLINEKDLSILKRNTHELYYNLCLQTKFIDDKIHAIMTEQLLECENILNKL